MPNHVEQKLTIVGSREDVEAFVVTARGAPPFTGDPIVNRETGEVEQKLKVLPICFHMIAPLDDKYSRESYGTGPCIGYNEEHTKWGVKWGPYNCLEPVLSADGTIVTYNFTCAWSYPKVALQRASQRYRTLQFHLSFGGEGPAQGRVSFSYGKVEIHYADFMGTDFPEYSEEDGDEDEFYENVYLPYQARFLNTHEEWIEDVVSKMPKRNS